MHGGSVQARSAGPDKGAEFVLRLPLAQAAAPGPALAPARPRPDAYRRVLVVDDNVDACASLAQILALEGFDVRACGDGAQALAAARDFAPDVAFIDLNMPRMTGLELAERLRAEPWGRAIRLVALTGMGQQGDLEATRAAGFYAHLTKPAAPEEVLRLAAAPADNVVPLSPIDARRAS